MNAKQRRVAGLGAVNLLLRPSPVQELRDYRCHGSQRRSDSALETPAEFGQ